MASASSPMPGTLFENPHAPLEDDEELVAVLALLEDVLA